MGMYRCVQMTFWTDPKMIEEFTAEEKYFYLYLITNPHTNLTGCCEIGKKQMSFETSLTIQKIAALIKSLVNKGVIWVDPSTNEILLINYWKNNWTESDKYRKALLKQIGAVKSIKFRTYLMDRYEGKDMGMDTYCIDTECIDTSNTITITNTNTNNTITNTNKGGYRGEEISRIVDYLNRRCNTHYKPDSKETVKKISARLEEGFTEDDCYKVIDNMATAWGNDDKMKAYLRPQTLFEASKFESYLNRPAVARKNENSYLDIYEELKEENGWS